jgi:hypothetical protein
MRLPIYLIYWSNEFIKKAPSCARGFCFGQLAFA